MTIALNAKADGFVDEDAYEKMSPAEKQAYDDMIIQ